MIESSRVSQADKIEELLDPNQDLPDVWLTDWEGARVTFAKGSYNIVHAAIPVGFAIISMSEEQREAWFEGINVYERENHFGLATYKNVIKAAVEQGYSFRNNPRGVSQESAHVWHKLAGLGVARVVEDFVEKSPLDINGYYVIEPVHLEEK